MKCPDWKRYQVFVAGALTGLRERGVRGSPFSGG